MAASNQSILIEQGSTYSLGLALKDAAGAPFDLTGCSITGKIRETVSSSSTLATFTGDIDNTPTTGLATILLSAAATSALPVVASDTAVRRLTSYAYDIVLILSDATVIRLLEGVVTVSPGATR